MPPPASFGNLPKTARGQSVWGCASAFARDVTVRALDGEHAERILLVHLRPDCGQIRREIETRVARPSRLHLLAQLLKIPGLDRLRGNGRVHELESVHRALGSRLEPHHFSVRKSAAKKCQTRIFCFDNPRQKTYAPPK
jgi:hypothetical protein